ncbi:unnamed protein product [Fraxinus pennsylvanica]|uniref:Fumarate lyase N-terminal domain-containing protein n=1 Tax=Fraxinus pennsylvanica TaxID=56036 RepID=A0AAD2DTY5_9LAMI|nr:unnamed protein product [Fraxinus pennsylvanica]
MPADFSRDVELSSLTALCPLDGRYWAKVKELSPFMSEFGPIRFRILVKNDGFSLDDALEVKNIERVTDHDVKAVEYFSKQRCHSHLEIAKVLEFFHFACTSEDINNLAHTLMLIEVSDKVILPVMDKLITTISNMATANARIPMLSRTHGQEMAIFAYRLSRERKNISQIEILGKFAGAVGNYNAHLAAYPDINWLQIAEEFVTSLGISFNPYVPQLYLIEPHDYMAKLFHSIIPFYSILVDFDRDMGIYFFGLLQAGERIHSFVLLFFKGVILDMLTLKQITKAGKIGSSTMLHKVNPIDFENSEGNLGMANGGLYHLSTKLPISRWQLGYGVPEPYEKLKELTRGRAVTKENIIEFIEGLEIPFVAKKGLCLKTYMACVMEKTGPYNGRVFSSHAKKVQH